MLFGYDNDGERQKPFPGDRAICAVCKGTLIAKCGDIYVWHWAHQTYQNCDPWKEHETDWHRSWKAKFPVEFQEVVIQRNGEKHIADIQTPGGTVIEFQNSSISTTTIQERENFHDDMIWVINAESFRDHFKLRSIVKTELKAVDNSNTWQINQVRKECEAEIKPIDDDIQRIAKDLELNSRYFNTHKEELKKWQRIIDSPASFISVILQKLSTKEERMEYDYSQILYKLNSEIRNAYEDLIPKIRDSKVAIRSNKTQQQNINNLQSYPYNNRDYKIVDFKQIRSAKYKKVIGVKKSTLTTLFPLVFTFKSEYEFINYPHIKDDYLLAIDLEDELIELSLNIQKSIHELEALESTRSIAETNLNHEINSILCIKLVDVAAKIERIEEKCCELSDLKSKKEKEREELLKENARKVAQAVRDINNFSKERRFDVMKVNKGLYTFRWKHERKSWQYATCRIYFDIGADYLFEYLDEETVQKISKSDFLQQFTS